MSDHLSDLQVGSRTQSQEDIQKVLDGLGYTADFETVSDQADPAPAGEPAGEKPPADPEPDAGQPAGEGEETDTTEAAEPAPAGEGEKPRKSGSAKLKDKADRLARENEELKRQLAERPAGDKPVETTTARPQETAQPDQETTPALRAMPTLDDLNPDGTPKYATWEDCQLDIIDWKMEKRDHDRAVKTAADEKAANTKRANDQAEADQKASVDRWNASVADAKTRHDDFDEVFAEAAKVPAALALTDAIQASDVSADLVYYLMGEGRTELDRLNKLLNLPQNASRFEQRRAQRLADIEVEKLEKLIAGDSAGDPGDTTGSATPQRTDAGREARGATPAKPKSEPAPAAASPAPIKPKPEPIDTLKARTVGRKKTLSSMTKEEIHEMQYNDPDGFRKLVEAA